MDNINIDDLKKQVLSKGILWTENIALRLRDRGIKRADVINCILKGEIIE
ncbi:MAG: DUF4258 domain-containing protein [Defluviitaleaceae bacterium]|nr:DUF4258 domain-containing protein [Defluviitaleaceae bacterium]